MNTAYNMDCMEAMRQMPDKCFDLAVVDPPYGLGIDGQKERYDEREPKHSRKAHARKDWDSYPPPAEYFRELARVSKNQIIWGGNYFVEALTAGHKGWIVWDKGQRGLTMSDCEIAYTSFDRPTRIVTINRVELLKEGTIHPTQKPVALYRWIFQHYARPGDKILDTHLGSGSSRIAAHEAGLDFMGFEIDPDYFAGALERYAAAEAQMSMFVQAAEREPPFEEIARTWAVTRGGQPSGEDAPPARKG